MRHTGRAGLSRRTGIARWIPGITLRYGPALLTAVLILCVSGCAPLPRLIVLHDPLTADEHIALGLGYERKGEYDYAIREYSKALKLSAGDYKPLFYTGNSYYRKGEYVAAEKYYIKAFSIAPDNGDIHNNLAWVYIDVKRFEDAKSEIDSALKIKRSPFYLDTLARLYNATGKYGEALKVLEEAIAMTPASSSDLLDSEHKLRDELLFRLETKRP